MSRLQNFWQSAWLAEIVVTENVKQRIVGIRILFAARHFPPSTESALRKLDFSMIYSCKKSKHQFCLVMRGRYYLMPWLPSKNHCNLIVTILCVTATFFYFISCSPTVSNQVNVAKMVLMLNLKILYIGKWLNVK